MNINRRSFFVRVAFGVLAAVMAARDAFAGVFRRIPYQEHIPPARYRYRLKWNIHERIWLKMWEKENNPPSWLNHGIGILEHCLDREPTPAEREACAGVMQWLGTNCGHGFLVETMEAQGYRITHDETLPNWKALKPYRYMNGPLPASITIQHRGQSFIV